MIDRLPPLGGSFHFDQASPNAFFIPPWYDHIAVKADNSTQVKNKLTVLKFTAALRCNDFTADDVRQKNFTITL